MQRSTPRKTATDAEVLPLTQRPQLLGADAGNAPIFLGNGAHWRAALRQSYEAISALEQPIKPSHRRQWEILNVRFHEALLSGNESPWTQKVLSLLARHGERYRRYAMGLPGSARDVHAEHTEIFDQALAGREARAALALEAHIRATPNLLAQALSNGQLSLPTGANPDATPALVAG